MFSPKIVLSLFVLAMTAGSTAMPMASSLEAKREDNSIPPFGIINGLDFRRSAMASSLEARSEDVIVHSRPPGDPFGFAGFKRSKRTYNGCSSDYQTRLHDNIERSTIIVQTSITVVKEVSEDDPRYTTYFGEYSPERVEIVEEFFEEVVEIDSYDWDYVCADSCSQESYGYWDENYSQYTLCPSYWGQSGDSQSLVLIEAAVEVKVVTEHGVGPSDDWELLAQRDPSAAVYNAPSYAKFSTA